MLSLHCTLPPFNTLCITIYTLYHNNTLCNTTEHPVSLYYTFCLLSLITVLHLVFVSYNLYHCATCCITALLSVPSINREISATLLHLTAPLFSLYETGREGRLAHFPGISTCQDTPQYETQAAAPPTPTL